MPRERLQIPLADTAERPEEIAQSRPDAFEGIGMHFPNPVAIVIARPLTPARRVTHLGEGATERRQVIVRRPLVGVELGPHGGDALHKGLQCLAIRMVDHFQANLAGRAPDYAGYRQR